MERRQEIHTCTAAYAIARVTLPSIPCLSALFARFGGPAPVGFPLRMRLSGSSRSPSAEDGDAKMTLKV